MLDKRTALEILVLKQGLTSLQGHFDGFRLNGSSLTRSQLLADRLRYGLVKYTYDPNYLAAKRKDLKTRLESQNELSQTRRPLPTDEHEPMGETEMQEDEEPLAQEEFNEPHEGFGMMLDPCNYALILDSAISDDDTLNTLDATESSAVVQTNEINEYVNILATPWRLLLRFALFLGFLPTGTAAFRL